MTIQQLFQRDFELVIGAQRIKIQRADPLTGEVYAALRATFQIERSDNRDPNRATIEIFNLSDTNRKIMQAGADLAESMREAGQVYDWPLVVNAGYVGGMAQIFSGDIVLADSSLQGTDWVTRIEAEDGVNAFRQSRLSASFGKGTPLLVVLNSLAATLGIGPGNSAAHFSASLRGLNVFENGVALNGLVTDLLDKYITGAGYTWSIQDGALQVLAPEEALLDGVVLLSNLTGLVGSPERAEKGYITARSLLQPNIVPGRMVTMVSKLVNGAYKATKIVHVGDTFGQDWYTEFEGKPLT